MKYVNEVKRIKELMSLINEGEGLKFLERLLTKGDINAIRKSEGAIDDVIKVLDDETISKLEQLGIRDATDLASRLSSLSEELATSVVRGLMRSSSDYSKMFFNLLRNNDSYDTAIKGLEDLIEKQSKKFKTQADVDKVVDALASKAGWDPIVTFNVKQNIKPKIDISSLVDGSADVSKIMTKVYAFVGGEENYKFFIKWLGIILGGSAIAGVGLWNLGPKAVNYLENRGKDPQFMDDELIKKIINGTLDSDFESYFPDYELAVPQNFKVKVEQLVKGVKSTNQTPYELELDSDFLKLISDGFHLKYVLDYAKSQGVNYVKDDLIDDAVDNIQKPFYMYKAISNVNLEEQFREFEQAREFYVKRYTSLEKKCEGQEEFSKVDMSGDPNLFDSLYQKVNNKVIAYLINKQKSVAAAANDLITDKAKNVLKLDLSTGPTTEEELTEQINSILGESTDLFPDLDTCEYKYSFQSGVNESRGKKSLGLVELLKKNELNEQGFGGKKNTPTKITPTKTTTTKKVSQPSITPVQPNVTTSKKSDNEIELEKLNRTFYFYAPQSSQPKNIQLDERIVDEVLNLKNDENIPLSLAYVIFVYENYGPISYINIPSEYSKDLLNQKLSVELPQIMESKGLINLLFEQLTPTRNRVTLKIEDGVVKQPTTNVRKNITIEDIINSNLELKPSGPSNSLPDESDIVYQVKFKLSQKEGNDKWNGDMNKVMTPEFSKFLSDYQTKNQLPITGNIDADLIKNLFPNVLKPKTTTVPPTTTSQKDIKKSVTTSEFANNKNVRDIITYSKRVDTTGEPDWDVCRMLIDEYSKKIPTIVQSISVGNLPSVSEDDPTLKSIKKSVEWCIAKHRNKFRLKISDMNRISNLEKPFSINKDIL